MQGGKNPLADKMRSCRYHPRFDNILLVINVVDKHIKGVNPLFQPRLNQRPVGGRYNARNNVKGKIRSVPSSLP